MSAELATVGGLGFISAILGFYAFRFRDSSEDMNQKFSVLFFFMSLVFMNLVMYSIYLMSQQAATYLTNGVMMTGLLVMLWLTVGLTFVLLLSLLIMSFQAMHKLYLKARGRYVEDT